MPTEVQATYRVVTPMFCAGASPAHAELRTASFKGVLRFWWRALAWSRYKGHLQSIQDQENLIFGAASVGQSRVSILPISNKKSASGFGYGLRLGQNARYLAYGLLERDEDKKRGVLDPGFDLVVRARVRDCDGYQKDLLRDALLALGTLGGMGARSRKGFGSTSIRSLHFSGKQQSFKVETLDELSRTITQVCSAHRLSGMPEYTGLSKEARHLLLSSDGSNPLELLDKIGGEFREAIRTVPPLQRVAFGLPRKPRNDRRASPLFIHIHECGDTPVAVLSFLPARFLPEPKPNTPAAGNEIAQRPIDELYHPIHDFLDRLLNANKLKVQEVKL